MTEFTAPAPPPGSKIRTAVLGAGLAGLAAATRLARAGHDVTVYEARDRVGGRVWSERISSAGGSHVIERGAEFVLSGYDRLRAHCADYDLALVDTGMSYYIRTPGDRPGVTTEAMASLGQAAADAAALGTGPRSVADVLDAVGAEGVIRDALVARIEMSTAVRVDEVTAERTLEHVASFEPGPSWRIDGGNQSLPNAMATSLAGRIRLGAKVTSVAQDGKNVFVTAGRVAEAFDYVVIALPFGVLSDPGTVMIDLPQRKLDAMSRVVQGNAAKLHLALEAIPETSAVMSVSDRFWTWTAVGADDKVSPVLNSFGGEIGHLFNLGLADDGKEWERRVRALRDDLPFSSSRAVLTAWPFDPLARGAYTAHSPEFTAADAEALAAPHGRFHFAGEYIDTEFTGLMEGALRSGERAATNVVNAQKSVNA